jgi:dipeptidyl aminopeptidase/acylaminoacyl peptidase
MSSIRNRAKHVMVAISTLGVVAGCNTVRISPPAAQPPQYAIRDFFANPPRAYFRLSPDGSTLSFMQPHDRRLNVHVQPIADAGTERNIKRLTAESARDIDNYFWKGSSHILYQKDFGGDENFHVVMVDVRDGTVRDLTPHAGVRASVVDDLPDDPNHVLIEHNRRNKEVFDVYRIDLRTGKETLVAQNPGTFSSWITDHAGRIRFAVASDGVDTAYHYRAADDQPFKEVLRTGFRDSVRPLFFDAKNENLYAISNRGRDKSALVLLNPTSAKETQKLYEHPDVDAVSAAWARKRKVLTFVSYQTDRNEQHVFDATSKSRFDKLTKKFPKSEITVQSETDDESLAIVAVQSDVTPGGRYLYNIRTDTATLLGEINPKIKPEHMASMQSIKYAARDGVTIHGYLTLPVGRPAEGLPLIVNPHGGPWVRDSWGFNAEVQFLANRGYAVFQPNYRGSTGYGKKFWELSFKQWGGTMQDDITDGVRWLVGRGIVDPKRVAIYGASYGGYATLAGIAKDPDQYAAAVSYVGVSNLFTFLNTIPPYWKPYLDQMHVMVGHPEKDRELFVANSPALNAHKIKTPLFVAQGAKDPRVNKAESDQMVEALRKRGVTVGYMVKDNEGHGFQNEENRFEFYEAMEKFLRPLLKPQ